MTQRRLALVFVACGLLGSCSNPASPSAASLAGSWSATLPNTGPFGLELREENGSLTGIACGFDGPRWFQGVPVTRAAQSVSFTVTGDKVSADGGFFVGLEFRGIVNADGTAIVGPFGNGELRFFRSGQRLCN
jgi:hypothetical protein